MLSRMAPSFGRAFFHSSLKFELARQWWSRGRHERHEMNNVISRVDREAVSALSQGRPVSLGQGLPSGDVLDMSNQPSALKLLGPIFVR